MKLNIGYILQRKMLMFKMFKFIFFLVVLGVVVVYTRGLIITKPIQTESDVLNATSTLDSIKNGIKDFVVADIKDTIKENISSSEPLKRFLNGNQTVEGNLTVNGTVVATNAERTKEGLKPLVYNAKLESAAKAKVADMFARQYFAHEAPTGEGPSELATSAGYSFVIVGENLALGQFVDDSDLVTAWMNSPGHRANILSSSYTEIGIAVGKGMYEGQEVWLAVQEFGTPLSVCDAPDELKKATLDTLKKQLDNMDAELAVLKKNVETKKDAVPADEYNALVRQYNAKVTEYNKLLEQSKKTMATYNTEVNAFNACVAGYTE